VGVLLISGEFPMQDFVERTNNFKERLETETDRTKRAILIKLLAEEETKHASRHKDAKLAASRQQPLVCPTSVPLTTLLCVT
jgi:hypothetical protein